MNEPRRLTTKQERFVEAIASGAADSLSDAARLAGYSADTPHEANVQGSRTLANVGVQAAIQARRASIAERAGLDAVETLRRIEQRARGGDAGEVPHAVRQRADETLVDILALREQGPVVDARSLTLAVTTEDVRALARLIAGESA